MVSPTGVICKVCNLGEIIQNSYEDYHCNVCGIKYKFLPFKELSSPKSNTASFQIQPGIFVSRIR